MSNGNEARSFTSVQDRLKMFEQQKPTGSVLDSSRNRKIDKKVNPIQQINENLSKAITQPNDKGTFSQKQPFNRNKNFNTFDTESATTTLTTPGKKVPPMPPPRQGYPPEPQFGANHGTLPSHENTLQVPSQQPLKDKSGNNKVVNVDSKQSNLSPVLPTVTETVKKTHCNNNILNWHKPPTVKQSGAQDKHVSKETVLKIENKSDLPPAVPTPPPTFTTVESNSLGGWAKTQNSTVKTIENFAASNIETKNKEDDFFKIPKNTVPSETTLTFPPPLNDKSDNKATVLIDSEPSNIPSAAPVVKENTKHSSLKPEKIVSKEVIPKADTRPDLPPRVPPPPATITKTQSNSLIGWAKTQNTKDKVIVVEKEAEITIAPNVDTVIKQCETNKPPPILVAPSTISAFEKCQKIKKETGSSFPDEDAYDEDEQLEAEFINRPWYFDILKAEATRIMSSTTKIGTYMVRPSDNKQYVLMVRAQNDVVKKFKIQNIATGWLLGDPTKCKRAYPTMSSLMEFYIKNGVKVGNSVLKLTEPASKQQ